MGRKPCCSKEGLKRGAWNAHEDKILVSYIKAHGEGHWGSLPIRAGLKRCGKSCRLRWLNYLRPGIKRGNISDDEEDLIIRLHKLLGNRWSLIAGRLPGRTDNEIKNYWNTTLAKRAQGRRQHCKPSKLTRPIGHPRDEKDIATVTTGPMAASAERSSSYNPRPPCSGADLIRTKALRCTRTFFYPKDAGEPSKPKQPSEAAACEIDAADNGLPACAATAVADSSSWGPADDEAARRGLPDDQEVGEAADLCFYSDDGKPAAAPPLDDWLENYLCFQLDSEFSAQSLDSLLDPEDPYWI